MNDCLSVGDVARRLGVPPRQITNMFYNRRLRDDLCPVFAGRRVIPLAYVKVISRELRKMGVSVRHREHQSGEEAERSARGTEMGADR